MNIGRLWLKWKFIAVAFHWDLDRSQRLSTCWRQAERVQHFPMSELLRRMNSERHLCCRVQCPKSCLSQCFDTITQWIGFHTYIATFFECMAASKHPQCKKNRERHLSCPTNYLFDRRQVQRVWISTNSNTSSFITSAHSHIRFSTTVYDDKIAAMPKVISSVIFS